MKEVFQVKVRSGSWNYPPTRSRAYHFGYTSLQTSIIGFRIVKQKQRSTLRGAAWFYPSGAMAANIDDTQIMKVDSDFRNDLIGFRLMRPTRSSVRGIAYNWGPMKSNVAHYYYAFSSHDAVGFRLVKKSNI